MTDEQWEQIKPFAEAHAAAQRAFTSAGMWNTIFDDPRKAIEQDVAYERLRAELNIAAHELARAKQRVMAAAPPPGAADG